MTQSLSKARSIGLFVLLFAILCVLSYLVVGSPFPNTDTQNLWFYSGLAMLLFAMFFVEPYYTAPKNVVSNSVVSLLVLLAAKNSLTSTAATNIVWHVAMAYGAFVLVLSLAAIILQEPDKSPDAAANRTAELSKRIAVLLGSAKIIYSGMFLFFLLCFHSVQKPSVLGLMVFWWFLVVTDPLRWVQRRCRKDKGHGNEIGQIIGVQSKKLFLSKLFADRSMAVKKFDVVEFNYSLQGYSSVLRGFVFDSYLLNEEKWVKILQLSVSEETGNHLKKNTVYKLPRAADPAVSDVLDRFVGVVIENSDIGGIKFEYAAQGIAVQEGDLVEVSVGESRVFYQIINGVTDTELLEAKNETGFIKGDTVQMGTWCAEKSCFEKFGWVPEINALVLKAKTDIAVPAVTYPDYELGKIPSTSLPAILNLNDAVSHHIAVLGVTGSGKSFIAREVICQLMADTKVICVDFTGEYVKDLARLEPSTIIHDKDGLAELEKLIAQKEDASTQKGNKKAILEYRGKIQAKLAGYVEEFMNADGKLALFELPDMSNSTFILEFTQMFLDSVFKYAKENAGQRICIAIEEAHTVVPETTSLGDLGDYGSNKALVNKIGQIALQGRKYGVGFMIIAQRTANVSKTVLTQCNSVICFQAFDNTSFGFLGNYIGQDLIKALPLLKPYHAIVVGKAFRSNVPMIVDLTRELTAGDGEVKETPK